MYQKLYHHQKKRKMFQVLLHLPKSRQMLISYCDHLRKVIKSQVSKDSKKLSTFVKHDKPKDQDNDIFCTKCNLVCKSVSELKKHKISCFKGRQYYCTYKKCDKSFSQKSIILQHAEGMHKNNPFICSICKEKYIFKKVMDAQMKCAHSTKKTV